MSIRKTPFHLQPAHMSALLLACALLGSPPAQAAATVDECRRIGFEPRVETVQITDRTWYRVVLGPYKEIPAAERDKKLIAERTKFQPIFVNPSPGNQEPPPR